LLEMADAARGHCRRRPDKACGRSRHPRPRRVARRYPLSRSRSPPEKIICVGVNFPDRNEEYRDGQAAPSNPSLFIRFPRSFTGHGQPLIRPPESPQLNYEGEIVIVIGNGGRRIPQGSALEHIAVFSLCNEGMIRDWVRHAKFNVTQGKNFDRTGSIGPWLVPFTEETQIADIKLETLVNGEARQQDGTSRMIFSFHKIINYVSTFTTLVAGDVIITGTPTGAGARFDPPIWLKPGESSRSRPMASACFATPSPTARTPRTRSMRRRRAASRPAFSP
jgi:2-keto-4-pentenoate hydratase/2-oxohepta-3-ene-1,7-dioic acid hydratase in catechol pathway